jgi:uncharacterized protein (DUF427 family)
MVNDPHQAQKRYWPNIQRERPTDIVVPKQGQESVWDYPRPPAVEPVAARLQVWFAGVPLADTVHGLRVIETSCPPVYYFPQEDVHVDFLTQMVHTTLCEWKGIATYWNVSIRGRRQEAVGWSYAEPEPGFERLKRHFAFYSGITDTCYVGTEQVQPQPGDYYGGWVTSNIVGPFKGLPGTQLW